MPGRSEKEIQEELNKVVEEGMFNISIASVVTVDENGADAMARIENIAANHHHMKVTITLDGETEPIYESAGIAPGQYIEHVKLKRTLSAGTYSATGPGLRLMIWKAYRRPVRQQPKLRLWPVLKRVTRKLFIKQIKGERV